MFRAGPVESFENNIGSRSKFIGSERSTYFKNAVNVLLAVAGRSGAQIMATRSVHLSGIFDKNTITSLADTIRDVGAQKNITDDEISAVFLSQGLSLSDQDLKCISEYYMSDIGRKEYEANKSVTARFKDTDAAERARLLRQNEDVRPRVDYLVRLHGLTDMLNNTENLVPVQASQIGAVLAGAYKDFSDSEIEEIISFYSSDIGQKCAAMMRTAGKALLKHGRGDAAQQA